LLSKGLGALVRDEVLNGLIDKPAALACGDDTVDRAEGRLGQDDIDALSHTALYPSYTQ
jgi:hypothetical protein